jgi:hypothetical protein
MRQFVELQGASGASYRYRLWRPGEVHLPIAGNYAVVEETEDGFAIRALDLSDDLSVVRQQLKPALRDQPGIQIYTRLNISRAVRTAENLDIVAATKSRKRQPAGAAEDSIGLAESPGE